MHGGANADDIIPHPRERSHFLSEPSAAPLVWNIPIGDGVLIMNVSLRMTVFVQDMVIMAMIAAHAHGTVQPVLALEW